MRFNLFCIVVLLLINFAGGALRAEVITPQNHYSVLKNEVPNAPLVVEFFSFYCRHCAFLENEFDISKKINEMLPTGEYVTKYHVSQMGCKGEQLTEAWSIAKILGVESLVEKKIFNAVQIKQDINRDILRGIFIDSGVPGERYDVAANSFAVKGLTIRQNQAVKDFDVTGTPSLIIKGKYLVKISSFNNTSPQTFSDDLVALVMYLINKNE
ncbi:protein disulfide oxidoreductase DsbA [Salmonella enterica subsp. enterica serovar Bareilly]|nr:protein disulfide oxidoreductase DsbA [Salmonella enterica subsp. enterica serovar Bareilly]